MPDRFLREALLTSRWAYVSKGAQLLYVRLLLKACDYGLYEAEPKLLAGVCYPIGYRAWPKQIAALLDELEEAGLVRRYEANGKRYVQLLRWKERARGKPRFPPPDGDNGGKPAHSPQEWANPSVKEENNVNPVENLGKSETSGPGNSIKTGLSATTVQHTSHDLPMPKPIAHMPKPSPLPSATGKPHPGNGRGRGYKPGNF